MKCFLNNSSDFIFFLNDLDPDGCLVADQLKVQAKILESTGADNKKGSSSELGTDPAKKRHHFLRWRSIFS